MQLDPTMETTTDEVNTHGVQTTTSRAVGGRAAPTTTSFLDETYLESSMASIDWSVTSRSDSDDSDDDDSDSDDNSDGSDSAGDSDDSSVSSMSTLSNPSAANFSPRSTRR